MRTKLPVIFSIFLIAFLVRSDVSVSQPAEPNKLLFARDVLNDGVTVVPKLTLNVAQQFFNRQLFGTLQKGALGYKLRIPGDITSIRPLMFITDPIMGRVLYADATRTWIKALNLYEPWGITTDNDEDNDDFMNVYVTEASIAEVRKLFFCLAPDCDRLNKGLLLSMPADGLQHPVDVTLNQGADGFGGNFSDYLWVLDDRTCKLYLYEPFGFAGARYQYGGPGYGVGGFWKPTAVACGRNPIDGLHTKTVYVADNPGPGQRLVELNGTSGARTPLQWGKVWVPNSSSWIDDIAVDSYGHLWLADAINHRLIKISPYDFSTLGTFGSKGTGPNQFLFPCTVGHPEGKEGWADLFVGEEWGPNSGGQYYVMGVDAKDLQTEVSGVNVGGSVGLEFYYEYLLADPAYITENIYQWNPNTSQWVFVARPRNNVTLYSGVTPSSAVVFPGTIGTVDYKIQIYATSTYHNQSGVPVNTDTLEAIVSACSPPLRGDVTLDCVIDISDLTTLVNYVVYSTPMPAGPSMGDANCDGVVDIVDIIYLLNYITFGEPVPCPF